MAVLGIGLLLREGALVCFTADDEFEEEVPEYVRNSGITLEMCNQLEGICDSVRVRISDTADLQFPEDDGKEGPPK